MFLLFDVENISRVQFSTLEAPTKYFYRRKFLDLRYIHCTCTCIVFSYSVCFVVSSYDSSRLDSTSSDSGSSTESSDESVDIG